MSFLVSQPGLLSLLQDAGRYGQHRIGLTTGGPLDPFAFDCCNRLLGNPPGAAGVEVSVGGLELKAEVDTFICATGAAMPLLINGAQRDLWQVHPVTAGDSVSLGFADQGCRSYFGVAEGFTVAPQFGSCATVVREHLGGLTGGPLKAGDRLPCSRVRHRAELYLAAELRPRYPEQVTVRLILGYQCASFSALEKKRLFSHRYTVSERSDRMGYRLQGPAIRCDIEGILSEGICYGALQVPADGQPIVLLNDRQTIGGYPKLGSALSLDAASLAQLAPGGEVRFVPIDPEQAHNALHLAASRMHRLPLLENRR